MAEGWIAGNMPTGGFNAVADAKARTGHYSHQLTVPDGAEVTWYQSAQDVKGAGPGRTYTFSVYVRTESVRDGYGAYCSIGCFDASGNRLAYSDSPDHLTGTVAEWRRVVSTMKIPAGTSVIKAILVFHGHGTAWFDDVQFEEGAAATEYHASLADEEALKADEREKLRGRRHLPHDARRRREEGRGRDLARQPARGRLRLLAGSPGQVAERCRVRRRLPDRRAIGQPLRPARAERRRRRWSAAHQPARLALRRDVPGRGQSVDAELPPPRRDVPLDWRLRFRHPARAV